LVLFCKTLEVMLGEILLRQSRGELFRISNSELSSSFI
jgi:hypothetical protein